MRPVLPALRAGLADLLVSQADGPGTLQVVLSTGDDLTRSLADGSHPQALPADLDAARAALPATLRARTGPDLGAATVRLLDAVGDELAARDESDRPERVVVLLVGEAGVGDAGAARERIAHQQSAYAWEFAMVDVVTGMPPAGAGSAAPGGTPAEDEAGTGDEAADGSRAAAPVAVAERPVEPAAAGLFGVPVTAAISAGPGADGVSAALAAASAFVTRARGSRPHEPVEGFSGDERSAAATPDGRPAWRRLLRLR
ncbi:hypothetical protein AFB00_28195 [Pseudonocardia sp. HH130630-07]|nr:hypothetical protein AFB00_28195 [Pseudonocardia sp. HH130630-07]